MKYNFAKAALVFGAGLLALTGCQDAEYQEITNRIYISEAAPSATFTQQTVNMTVVGQTTTTLHVRLAQPVDRDVRVTLDYAPEALASYNERNGANYVQLDSKYVQFTNETVIPAGSLSSDPVEIQISEFPTDSGESFCIPIKIASTDAPVEMARTTNHLLYLLSTPLRQIVPTMNANTFPEGTGDWGITTSEWTLEAWIWMSSFSINNQAIFNAPVSKGTEIYIRFGDADLAYDKLQIKTGGSQFNSNQSFSPNTWYHVAFTYASGKCTMYINGIEDSSKEFAATDYVINSLQLCSSGSYFRANARMAQVRFWKKALSASAIKDGMSRLVALDSDGLFGYWKLDDGSGSIYHDATGNGYDLTCRTEPEWGTEEVDFSDPNK